MKIARKKIPKGSFLLAASFAAISACLLLVLSSARSGRTDALNRNGLYSGYQRSFGISNAEGDRLWDDIIPVLDDKFDNFALFLSVEDTSILVKGTFLNGEAEATPLLWGRYFDNQTSWTEHPTAVLGKDYQKDAAQRGRKLYYTYRDVEYEVIGIMGTEEKSRLDRMLVVDFRSALQMAGVNTSYVLDAKREADIIAIGEEMQRLIALPAELGMFLGEREDESMLDGIFSSGRIMDTVYTMALGSFFLSTILVATLWLRFRRSLFYAWALCGYRKSLVLAEITRRFLAGVAAGTAIGQLSVLAVSLAVPDLPVGTIDILKASGVSLGLGAAILLLCVFPYLIRKQA